MKIEEDLGLNSHFSTHEENINICGVAIMLKNKQT